MTIPKIRPSLMRILQWRVGFSEIGRMAREGTISPADWLGYQHIWRWAAPRHSFPASLHHDAFVVKYGLNAYQRRINKVRQAVGLPPI